MKKLDINKVEQVLEKAKKAAVDYRKLTGKPLGITGEYGEYIAAKQLKLSLAKAREPGFDAIDRNNNKVQIKARVILNGKMGGGQRISKINSTRNWHYAVLVLLSEDYEPLEIHKATRKKIIEELDRPGSKSRNVRRALSISKFKALGKQLWP